MYYLGRRRWNPQGHIKGYIIAMTYQVCQCSTQTHLNRIFLYVHMIQSGTLALTSLSINDGMRGDKLLAMHLTHVSCPTSTTSIV
jgi:hypothetical protein